MHPIVRYVLIATPLCVLLFLALASFFTSWEGHVVSHRPAPSEDPAVYTVLIVTEDGDGLESDWPAELVRGLDLQIDPTGTPPNKIPEEAARTRKAPFALFFTVTPDGEESEIVSTSSARNLSVAIVAWFVGLFLFNMYRSGSPFSWEARERALPESQDANLQMHQDPNAQRRAASRKGPPPPRPRRGQGRRR